MSNVQFPVGTRVKVVFDRVTHLNNQVGTIIEPFPASDPDDVLVLLETGEEKFFAPYELKACPLSEVEAAQLRSQQYQEQIDVLQWMEEHDLIDGDEKLLRMTQLSDTQLRNG